METKLCTCCKETKPLTEFSITKRTRSTKAGVKTDTYNRAICKSCSRIKASKSKRKATKRNKSMEE